AGNELIALLQQRVEGEELRRVARGDRERCRTPFKRGDAALEHRLRGVGDAGVDIAEGLQPEQRGGVVGVVKDVGGGLVDRRRARARRRVGGGAGVPGGGG